MSCDFATLDAAYVLGSLAPAERAEYELHLRTCDACAAAVRDLAGLPGLLARVPVEVLENPVLPQPVPETLLPSLVAAARKEQRRRTVRTSLLAAAAAAAIAAGAGVVATTGGDGGGEFLAGAPTVVEPSADPQRMTPVGPGTSDGWVTLTPTADGATRVELTCTYDSDAHPGVFEYRLVVLATDGRMHSIPFEARTGEEVTVTGSTTIAVDEIDQVVVESPWGPVLELSAS